MSIKYSKLKTETWHPGPSEDLRGPQKGILRPKQALFECCPVSQLIARSSHQSEQMSQRSQVSRIALRRCSQNVFVFVIVFVFVVVNFFGHVMSSHHPEQMSQRSQVSRATL